MQPIIVWSIILVMLVLLAYYVTRMAKRNSDGDGEMDLGFAIMHFGRAFPNEAICELH